MDLFVNLTVFLMKWSIQIITRRNTCKTVYWVFPTKWVNPSIDQILITPAHMVTGEGYFEATEGGIAM